MLLQVNDAIDKILRKKQTTCLLVAHRLSTIARAERIVVLEGLQPSLQISKSSLKELQTVTSPNPGRMCSSSTIQTRGLGH